MGRFAIRYLVAKRQKGHTLFYWQPNRPLRVAGFPPRRLSNDLPEAIREAEALNHELDRWRAGHGPVTIQPGTIPWLVRLYRADQRYTDLADATKDHYDGLIPSSRLVRSRRPSTNHHDRAQARPVLPPCHGRPASQSGLRHQGPAGAARVRGRRGRARREPCREDAHQGRPPTPPGLVAGAGRGPDRRC